MGKLKIRERGAYMHDNSNLSFLKFSGYSIDNFVFKRNHAAVVGDSYELKFHFKAELLISDKKDEAMVKLTCRIFDENFANNSAPFFLEAIIQGHFNSSEEINIGHFRINAVSILMPYLRATISSFAAQSGIGLVTIPIMNVANMFEENDNSKYLSKDEQAAK
jgi:preprotein translocase subunit SecB